MTAVHEYAEEKTVRIYSGHVTMVQENYLRLTEAVLLVRGNSLIEGNEYEIYGSSRISY